MANFKTHLVIATSASGVASVALLSLQLASLKETGGYFLLGIVGGLLPDIDSDNSTPLTFIFYLLSMYCAFVLVFNLAVQYSFAELLVIWGAAYFVVRYLVFRMVTKLTVHRGVFHSLLAVGFVVLLTTNISFHFLKQPAYMAWHAGIFVGLGYFVHLCLDELYSVDLNNKRMKKSFGTALKLFSRENPVASLLMLTLLCVFINYAPPAERHWQAFNHAIAKHDLQKKWFPKRGHWFEDFFHR